MNIRKISTLVMTAAIAAVFAGGASAAGDGFTWMRDGASDRVTWLWPSNQMPMASATIKTMPHLRWYKPPLRPNGTCMILISGGGYNGLCDGLLLLDWYEKLAERGVQCVELQYRTRGNVGKDAFTTQMPLADAQRAVRIVRRLAGERGYSPDRIGAMGMSAGAHLTARLASSSTASAYERIDEIDDTPCNINYAITAAIAYGLKNINVTKDPVLGSDFAFDDKTPPMCMLHGGNDGYSPLHSTAFYRRLREKGLYAELHLYAGRSHGFWGKHKQPIDIQATYDNWFEPMEDFLAHLGVVAKPPRRATPRKPDESKIQLLTRPGTPKDDSKPTMYLLTDTTADTVAPTVAAIAEWEALRAKKIPAELHTLSHARPDARDHRVWEYLNGNELNDYALPEADASPTNLPTTLEITGELTVRDSRPISKRFVRLTSGKLRLEGLDNWIKNAGVNISSKGDKAIEFVDCKFVHGFRVFFAGEKSGLVWKAQNSKCTLRGDNQIGCDARVEFTDSDITVAVDKQKFGGTFNLANSRLTLMNDIDGKLCDFSLKGENAAIYALKSLTLASKIAFTVPKGGYAAALPPVRAVNRLTLSGDLEISLDATAAAPGEYRLMRANSIALPEGGVGALKLKASCAAGHGASLKLSGDASEIIAVVK